MPTDSQIQANRRNAKKSTGPRSAEGKAASSQNALKTGIDAKSPVIRGEDHATLEALATRYHERFQPATPSGEGRRPSCGRAPSMRKRLDWARMPPIRSG